MHTVTQLSSLGSPVFSRWQMHICNCCAALKHNCLSTDEGLPYAADSSAASASHRPSGTCLFSIITRHAHHGCGEAVAAQLSVACHWPGLAMNAGLNAFASSCSCNASAAALGTHRVTEPSNLLGRLLRLWPQRQATQHVFLRSHVKVEKTGAEVTWTTGPPPRGSCVLLCGTAPAHCQAGHPP